MKKIYFSLLFSLLLGYQAALAAPQMIAPPADLPPGAMSYGNVSKGNLAADPNIVAAVIGVGGLIVGSAITIFSTAVIRRFDIKREDRREEIMLERYKKEKEYNIKQEIYKNFLNELALMETFSYKDAETFKRDWIKTEVKIDLVASPKVRQAKEKLQKELLILAEKNIKSDSANITTEYIKCRDEMLEAIRADIDLSTKKSS